MNPDTNKFEQLETAMSKQPETAKAAELGDLLRPDGTPCPKHWTVFQVNERVVIKGYTFEVKYIGETAILFEPVGIPVL